MKTSLNTYLHNARHKNISMTSDIRKTTKSLNQESLRNSFNKINEISIQWEKLKQESITTPKHHNKFQLSLDLNTDSTPLETSDYNSKSKLNNKLNEFVTFTSTPTEYTAPQSPLKIKDEPNLEKINKSKYQIRNFISHPVSREISNKIKENNEKLLIKAKQSTKKAAAKKILSIDLSLHKMATITEILDNKAMKNKSSCYSFRMGLDRTTHNSPHNSIKLSKPEIDKKKSLHHNTIKSEVKHMISEKIRKFQ